MAEKKSDNLSSTAEEATEKGFRGVRVDPTPDEAYTVSGVTSGQPTPETDEGAASKAAHRAKEVEEKFQSPKKAAGK